VFAEEVLFMEHFGERAGFGIGGHGVQSQGGDLFHKDGIVTGVGGGFAPAEGVKARDKDARRMERIAFPKATDDGQAGVALKLLANFSRGERLGDWHGAVKEIGMACPKTGDFALRLSSGRGGE
jgi:hypothetical protein